MTEVMDFHGWNGAAIKPEQDRLVECITKKNGVSLMCTYRGGHEYIINGLAEGTINEHKVKIWRYK